MLQIRFLGQFDVRVDGQRIVIPSRAGQSLFAYLVLTAGTMHRREKLAGLFWPDTADEQARHSLRSELWRVRKAIQRQSADNQEFLLSDEYALGFNPDADYWLDAVVLQSPAQELDSLAAALVLYQGELLPGLYDDWVLLERDRLHAVFENKMQELLARLIQEARWHMVLEWSEKWIALGQTPEAAYRALMIANAAVGNRAGVAATYERCRADLDEELGVEPSDETRGLYEQLMRGETVARVDLYSQPIPPIRLVHVEEPPAPGEPPFKGLEYFDEGDADLFFGREELTAELAHRLTESGFLAVVVGASGSGKSSLVRAGLVPKLRSQNREARIVVFTPTAHPLEALALALTHSYESVTATATLMDDLSRDARALYLYLKGQSIKDTTTVTAPRFILVVDQFEELFTLCRDELEREQFIDNLVNALTPFPSSTGKGVKGNAVALVLTLRADFYAHLAQYAKLRELAVQHQEYIGPMTTDELRRAIGEPAKQRCAENGAPWAFEPGLVDLLLRDVGGEPGALPLLSHVLLETWKRRSGHTMTLKGYHDAGGVRGAIAQTAETVYQRLDVEQQHIARNIFLRLTELGEGTEDTRRRATFQELIPQGENGAVVRAVLTQLADSRLVTLAERTAEVAHEALIREWGRLREWLNEDREGLRLHRQLTEAAREWELLERDAGALYRGARLAQAREWAEQNPIALNAQERAFLEASDAEEKRETREREEQQQRELVAVRRLAEEKEERLKVQANANQRLRRRAIFLASVSALAIVLALIAIFFAKSAGENATAAQNAQAVAQDRLVLSEKQRFVAEGNVALEDKNSADVAALLALHVLKNGYDDPADRLLLHALEHDYPRMIFKHDTRVWTTDISPDGKYIVTGSDDKLVHLWDAQSGREIRQFVGNRDGVYNARFSPDGKFIVTNGDSIRVWNVETGEEINRFASDLVIGFVGLAISPDGAYIAASDFNSSAVRVWDIGGHLKHWLQGHNRSASAVQFSSDGTKLFSVDADGIGILWDLANEKEIRRFVTNGGNLWSAAISPDGKFVAAAGPAKTIWLWNVETGALVREFVGHQAGVGQLAFLPDGKSLVSASDDGSVRLWSIETGETLHQFLGHRGRVLSLAVSRDGKTLVTAGTDGKALRWEIFPEREPLVLNDQDFNDAGLAPDGQLLAVSANQVLTLYNPTNGAVIRNLTTLSDYPVDTLRFSPDGKFLFGRFDFPTGRRRGFLWDAQTGQVLNEFRDPLMRASAAFSPDGKSILTASEGGAYLWTLDRATPVQKFEVPPGSVGSVAFSPDGKSVATTSYQDKSAAVWDLYTAKEIRTFIGHTGEVEGVDFSPDGKQLATASQDKTVRLWDIASGKELRQFVGHTAGVRVVKFSPDGKFLLSGGDDHTARLWEMATGNQVREFTTQGKVTTLGFYLDGKRVFVVADDGTVRIWRLDLNEVIQMACARLPRDLDAVEIQEYNISNYVPVCPKK